VSVTLLGIVLAAVHQMSWLQCLYILTYIKVALSLIKYIPQAWPYFMGCPKVVQRLKY
jgi:hypothetical protein